MSGGEKTGGGNAQGGKVLSPCRSRIRMLFYIIIGLVLKRYLRMNFARIFLCAAYERKMV